VQESPLARSKKLPEVIALLPELGGDARALLDALREKRVAGFHAKLIEEAEDAWSAAGLLDPRTASDASACHEAMQRRLEPELRAGAVTLEEVARLADWWWRAVERGERSGSA
jgi:hypothetical protein